MGLRYDRSIGKEEQRMHPQRLVRQALGLGLLMALVVLALSACGGNQQASKPRPLPEDEKALRPGVYRSEEFKPSLSFRVGEGWKYVPLEASDELHIARADETGGLGFAITHEVYKPTRTGTPNVVEAPKDLVGWFQHHPYLQTSKPEPSTVGGVKGVQFDVLVENLPDDYHGRCGLNCVDIARLSSGSETLLGAGYKLHLIVLEDVKGATVSLGFSSPTSDFDEFAPKAQTVVDSVKWTSS
jgi:hypothetical protein